MKNKIHLTDANEKLRSLMIDYVDSSANHDFLGICSFMRVSFKDEGLDSYDIIEALGVNGYLGDRHGANKERIEFANRVVDNIAHPGIQIFRISPDDCNQEGFYKIVASSKIPGAKQARERIFRFARKNSGW